jgi:hypothetical protein
LTEACCIICNAAQQWAGNFEEKSTINFYFYFHHRVARLDEQTFPAFANT